jgi:hypothetical protein
MGEVDVPLRGSENGAKPWLGTVRRRLSVQGRQGVNVTIVVMVYRDTVWVSTSSDEPFSGEAVLELTQVGSLIDMLTWAAGEASTHRDG